MLTETGDASNTLFSERYKQTYHSKFGAITESMHVFLHGARVVDRLQAGLTTRVLEIGLGLGLNCLLSADCAATEKTQLHYTGVEHAPISGPQLHALDYQQWLKHPTLVDDLANLLQQTACNELGSSQDEMSLPGLPPTAALRTETLGEKLGEFTTVNLHIADASSQHLLSLLSNEPKFDAIFLDAFSPEHNPECWTLDFFNHLHRLLAPNGQLATYCVKGTVRRNLESAGFKVEKYPGPMGKREVLRAC